MKKMKPCTEILFQMCRIHPAVISYTDLHVGSVLRFSTGMPWYPLTWYSGPDLTVGT